MYDDILSKHGIEKLGKNLNKSLCPLPATTSIIKEKKDEPIQKSTVVVSDEIKNAATTSAPCIFDMMKENKEKSSLKQAKEGVIEDDYFLITSPEHIYRKRDNKSLRKEIDQGNIYKSIDSKHFKNYEGKLIDKSNFCFKKIEQEPCNLISEPVSLPPVHPDIYNKQFSASTSRSCD